MLNSPESTPSANQITAPRTQRLANAAVIEQLPLALPTKS